MKFYFKPFLLNKTYVFFQKMMLRMLIKYLVWVLFFKFLEKQTLVSWPNGQHDMQAYMYILLLVEYFLSK